MWSLSLYLCLKVSILFLGLILVRITVPRLRIETLSKTGWASGFTIFAYVFIVYAGTWFLV